MARQTSRCRFANAPCAGRLWCASTGLATASATSTSGTAESAVRSGLAARSTTANCPPIPSSEMRNHDMEWLILLEIALVMLQALLVE